MTEIVNRVGSSSRLKRISAAARGPGSSRRFSYDSAPDRAITKMRLFRNQDNRGYTAEGRSRSSRQHEIGFVVPD
jgi:hypothetical protein